MPNVVPFRPYRYTDKAGPLDNLVTQPYDKVTPAMRTTYLNRSLYNFVRIILGEPSSADTDTDNVYTRARQYLQRWTADGMLERDAAPGFYPYFQEFVVPETGERVIRKGFIGLGPVVDYSDGVVHRHEQTLSGPKKDRLDLLRGVRAHLGQIFMLYSDPKQEVDRLLDEASSRPPLASVADDFNAVHRLWRTCNPDVVSSITRVMEDKKLLIADGHHRYETALAFRKENPDLPTAERVMMTFVNMNSPGLRILATHRLVNGLRDLNAAELATKIQSSFQVSTLDSAEALQRRWSQMAPETIRIGVAVAGTDKIFLLEASRQPGQLDVGFLHQALLQGVLGIGEEAVRDEKYLSYVRGLSAAVDGVRQGEAQVAFLLEPTTVEQVADVSFSGGVMPQKSTDFFPKLLSGFTIYNLDD